MNFFNSFLIILLLIFSFADLKRINDLNERLTQLETQMVVTK